MHHTGSPLHDDDQEEVFTDVVVAQHNSILKQILNAIDLFDKKLSAAIRQMIDKAEITAVSHCPGRDQLADC